MKALFRTRAWMSFILAILCALGPALSVLADNHNVLSKETSKAAGTGDLSQLSKELVPNYAKVLEEWKKKGVDANHSESFTISGSTIAAKSDNAHTAIDSYQGKDGVLVWSAKGDEWIEYDLNVTSGGLYAIEMSYHPFVDSRDRKPIALSLTVDGSTPFMESKSIELYRHWKDKLPIRKDDNGDEIRPAADDISGWLTWELRDMSGAYTDPLLWNLSPGSTKSGCPAVIRWRLNRSPSRRLTL
ncbi:carbohydrate-binding protein [Paenibacillus hexagrammi]|uniref:Uncharacterized protein n=1 Tax=Paenibacillus hexagrammi TaxID=2908839 RepID=A0ABY3SPZ4_9BACL|nr:hypothetical protein [Paenibacillus sp. YPD9-1]UJF35615.1 hypothetical protein L0M14_11275 [Paenibacillus sp. YPD9-1]